MGLGCSKESSHRDGSFEYPQHMFWLRNKKIICSFIWRSDNAMLKLKPIISSVEWSNKGTLLQRNNRKMAKA